MCDGCRSLNDMPANKCYKCRTPRPASPTLLDDQYGQVSDKPRVGVSVDLSRVAELASRDPLETQKGAGVFEAFTAEDDLPVESARARGPAFTTAQQLPREQPVAGRCRPPSASRCSAASRNWADRTGALACRPCPRRGSHRHLT